MKIICAPHGFDFASAGDGLQVILYGRTQSLMLGSAGAAIREDIARQKLQPAHHAWDFLSIALSVLSADLAGHRNKSPDGWTREFDVHIAVADKAFWDSQKETLEQLLKFLTTDRWSLHFLEGGFLPNPTDTLFQPEEDSVVLVSGGLDSFIGVLDLVAQGKRPYAVSQSVRGDAEKQRELTSLAGNLRHLQLNHNVDVPDPENPPSQRARSIVFFAYGVLAATALAKHHAGEEVTLYVCENGFITINPPLTDTRLGSLSTRTCHPVLVALLQQVLDAAGLRVKIVNPYRLKTKGEMLSECGNQTVLRANANKTTSCGRFKRHGYKHCGRCVPCLIRRAAFHAWGVVDKTEYVFKDLSRQDKDHAKSDDVRSVALALATVEDVGLDRWLGATLVSSLISNKAQLKEVITRGLAELRALLTRFRIQ